MGTQRLSCSMMSKRCSELLLMVTGILYARADTTSLQSSATDTLSTFFSRHVVSTTDPSTPTLPMSNVEKALSSTQAPLNTDSMQIPRDSVWPTTEIHSLSTSSLSPPPDTLDMERDNVDTTTTNTPIFNQQEDESGGSEKQGETGGGDGLACASLEAMVTDMEKTIWWTDPEPACSGDFLWTVTVPQDYGLGFQFHDVEMMHGRSLEILTFNVLQQQWEAERVVMEEERNVPHFHVQINMSPLLVNHSQVKIMVKSPRSRVQPDEQSPSFMNISYFAHGKRVMPASRPGFDLSLTRYECFPDAVPKVLLCNMVPECMDGEDEAGCLYREEGCEEGWIPYRQQCLRLDFLLSCPQLYPCELIVRQQHPTLATNANKLCGFWFDAKLAATPEKSGLALVTTVVRQSGFRSVSMAINKYTPSNRKVYDMYRHVWQWGGKGGPIAYEHQDLEHAGPEHRCAMMVVDPYPRFVATDCARLSSFVFPDGFVCSMPNPRYNDEVLDTIPPQTLSFPLVPMDSIVSNAVRKLPLKDCSDGSKVFVFERCLWGDMKQGAEWSANTFQLFHCQYSLEVHYTLVCDGKEDCADGSDEANCAIPRFTALLYRKFICDNHQILFDSQYHCNGRFDCYDGSDEDECDSCTLGYLYCSVEGCLHVTIGLRFPSCPHIAEKPVPAIPKPGVVRLESFGVSEIDAVEPSNTKFLFECRPGFYLPTYLLGNGEVDCPGGEDESIPPENIVCPGYYRCESYGICVHPDNLCDGIYNCPNKDDEIYCFMPRCPSNCICEGYAFSCQEIFEVSVYPLLRYLDLSGVKHNISFEDFYLLELLKFLNLSRCDLDNVTLSGMPGLSVIDLSFNKLAGLSAFMLKDMVGLTYLDLTGNPLLSTLDSTFNAFLVNASLVNLETLIMERMNVHSITEKPFENLIKLSSLDLRGNPLDTYEVDALAGLRSLAVFYTDESKLCCSYFHDTEIRDCHAPVDELSSCEDLLRNNFFRVFLWVMSVFAVLGNASVIVYRLISSVSGSPTFRALVVSLCASDMLMGFYMVMIGSADVHFRSVYVSVEKQWRHSAVCTLAGFLAFVSSEVSNLIIFLITVDRLVVLTVPLKKHMHMTAKQAITACCAAWLTGIVLASVPLLSGMEFYELNAVCVPLPITRDQFTGKGYAFGVFIVFNFLLVLLIGFGQLFIYRAVRQSGSAAGTVHRDRDVSIARRLLLIAFSNFCCWFPVGVIGLLAYRGVAISGVVNLWTSVFLLPINAAINPFLYTLNGALENLRQQRMKEKMKKMIGNLQHEIPKWKPPIVEETARICIQTKHVSMSKVQHWMGLQPGQGEQAVQGGQGEPLGQTGQANQTGQAEQAKETRQGEQAKQAGQAKQTGQGEQAKQTGQANQTGQGEQAKPTGQGKQSKHAGQGEQAKQTGQGEQAKHTGQGEQAKQTGQGEQSNQTGQGYQAKQTGQGEQAKQTGQGEQAKHTGQGEQAKQTGQGEQTKPTGQGEQSTHAGQGEQTKQTGQGEQAKQTGQGEQSTHAGQGEQTKQTGQGEQAKQTMQGEHSRQTAQGEQTMQGEQAKQTGQGEQAKQTGQGEQAKQTGQGE